MTSSKYESEPLNPAQKDHHYDRPFPKRCDPIWCRLDRFHLDLQRIVWMDLFRLDDVAGFRIQSSEKHVQEIHLMNS